MASEKITVSNGREVHRIHPDDLVAARLDGFYRPFERGQTIVGEEGVLFEVPIADLPSAKQDGLSERLQSEREAWNRQQVESEQKEVGRAPVAANPTVTVRSQTSAELSQPTRVLPKPPAAYQSVPKVLTELSLAEQQQQQYDEQSSQTLEETKGWRWYLVWFQQVYARQGSVWLRQMRGTGISVVVHVAVLMILASLILNTDSGPKGLLLTAAPETNAIVEEVIIEPSPLEISEPTENIEAAAAAESEPAKIEVIETPDFAGAIKGDAIKPPALPGDAGSGRSRSIKRASFFGKRVAAVNYVFVIDNSNSMTGGRFETALNELMIAVNQLTPRQRFYVLFYSDTAYPMFHPSPAQQLVPATPRNKQRLSQWLTTVELCNRTNGREAITAAFALKPDVIFVLGDGAFTDNAADHFAANPQSKIPLHTLGMEVKAKDADSFERLAKANGGTYKDVGVAPGARELFRMNPRPRNKVPGKVWGLKLKPRPN
ncbi:MAG: VWA domain-containing protein [Planctomycetota bacterium]